MNIFLIKKKAFYLFLYFHTPSLAGGECKPQFLWALAQNVLAEANAFSYFSRQLKQAAIEIFLLLIRIINEQ